MGKRKTPGPDTGKEMMDAPLDIDGLASANPLPDPAWNYSQAEKKIHEGFMQEALVEAQRALDTDETPVSCVIVHDGNIIARGMNATNRTMNGTRHAEFQAIASILSDKPLPAAETPNIVPRTDPSRPRYSVDVLKECDLYVTVEPCIMCASLLRQYGIRKVYFGAANDRFGGAGGVMDIHSCEAVDPPYPVSGGWLREEAIMLLRRFYIQTNINAPQPINKKERVLKEEVAPAGTPVNRIVTSVELALQKAQEKLAKTAAAKQPEGL